MRRFQKLNIRTPKDQSAFVYFIMESMEGVVSYSTLPNQIGDPNRDLELRFAPEFESEVRELLTDLGSVVSLIP